MAECLESVLGQKYIDKEILLIDDGSTDNSRRISEKYAERNECIQLLRQENKGAALARQCGLEVCTGEYVVFVDADDYLADSNVLGHLVEIMEEGNADIVCGDYSRLWNGKLLPAKSVNSFSHYSPETEEFRFCGFFSCGNLSYVWAKMYRKSFLQKKGIHFCEFRYSEDKLFNISCYLKEAKYAFLTMPTYVYRKNEHSVSYQYRKDSVETWIGIAKEIHTLLLKEKKEKQDNLVGYSLVFAAAFDAIMNENTSEGIYSSVKELLKHYRQDDFAGDWFVKMSQFKRVRKVPSFLWRLMIGGFSLCMRWRFYDLLVLGMRMMVKMRIDESLSDNGKRE